MLTAADKGATLANAQAGDPLGGRPQLQHGLYATSPSTTRIIDNGKAPILLEPVKATIELSGRPVAAVRVLDHDGRRTDKQLSLENGRFVIDGARDHALYYEVVFP